MPWNDYGDKASGACSDPRCTNNPAAYRAYLGSVFNGQPALNGQAVAADGSNISNTAIAYLQAKGIDKGPYNQGFYFPSMTQTQFNSLSTGSSCLNPPCATSPANSAYSVARRPFPSRFMRLKIST